MPTHTSDSSASAGHRSSWATVTGGSRHQSQRRIDTRLLCYALHQGKHKQVRLVLSLSVFYLHSAASKNEVVKGSQLRMLLMCLVKVSGGRKHVPTFTPKTHIQDSFTSTGQRSSYTTLLGALECQSERRKLDSFCCAPTVTCELVGLLLYTLQHCSMKKDVFKSAKLLARN